MSPTEEAIQTFRQCMPDAWIYRNFQQEKIEDLVRVQRKCIQEKKGAKDMFLVLDDCMYDKKALKSTSMRELFMNGRHLHVSMYFAVQYLMDLSPDLRSNVDYIIATREMIMNNRLKLWKYFFGMFERFEDFSRVMDKCTQNYSCLVLDNTVNSTRLEDCVFWYRAETQHPPFRMGKEVYWKLSEQYSKTEQQRRVDDARRQELLKLEHDRARRKEPMLVQVADERGNLLTDTESRPNAPRIKL